MPLYVRVSATYIVVAADIREDIHRRTIDL